MKKHQFWQDNGFSFYTGANRRDQYIKMMKPHDEVYNSSKYRFALLDGSMDRGSFLMCAMNGVDFYNNWMGSWRITDSAFVEALIHNTGMKGSRFYENIKEMADNPESFGVAEYEIEEDYEAGREKTVSHLVAAAGVIISTKLLLENELVYYWL